MAGMSSLGMGSGLDIRSIVDQLVAAERAPMQGRLDRKEVGLQSRLSAYGALKGALSKFRDTVGDLTDISTFQAMKATSSDEDAVAVSASSGAQTGRFDIEVSTLAESQSVASKAFSATNAAVGSGKLVFKFGTVTADDGSGFTQNAERGSKTVTIEPGSNTLSDVRDAVNAAEIGVTASIINDGSGERLIFTAADTGADNGFTIEAQDDDGVAGDGTGLSQLAFDGTNADMSRTRAGQDAQLNINGLAITRSGNEIDDAIEGVTFDLKTTTTSRVTVDVATDVSSVKGKIMGFVAAFNEFQGQVRKLTSYNADTQQGSALTGDALARNVTSALRRTMTESLGVLEGSAIRALSDLGIMTKRDGSLEVDSDKLDDALKDNFDLVGAMFASTGLPSNDAVEYVSGRGVTQPGRYDVEVTQLATQGTLSGGALPAFPLTIDADNDQFRIEVDGTQSGDIVLSQGSYATPQELAAELQAKINGDSDLADADAGVAVEYDTANNRFVVRSSSYGSESTVEIVSSDPNFGTELGLSGAGTGGQDVAGTIGGAAATGEGQHLIGATGSDAEGLKLRITGNATGALGSVTFSRGLMTVLDEELGRYLDSDGVFSSTTERLQDRLDSIADDRDRLERRMARVEERYLAQFTAMDALVAQMNSTQQFLTNQLASLPKPKGS